MQGPADGNGGRETPVKRGRDAPSQQAPQPQGQAQGWRGKKRGKDERIGQMHMAIKYKDLPRAMEIWREMAAEGSNQNAMTFNSLLFLAAGGEDWEALSRGTQKGIRAVPKEEQERLAAWRAERTAINKQKQMADAAAAKGRAPPAAAAAAAPSTSAAAAAAAAAAPSKALNPSASVFVPGGAAAAAPPAASTSAPPAPTVGGPSAAAAGDAGAGAGAGVMSTSAGAAGAGASSGANSPSSASAAAEGALVPLAELLAAGAELWGAMQASGSAKPDHGTFLSLARLEALKGDADQALHWANQCLSGAVKFAQLRNFHPALVVYGLRGDCAAVKGIDTTMQGLGLDLSEYEFARLIEGLANGNGAYGEMRSLLLRIQDNLTMLQPSTLALVRQYFESSSNAREALHAPPDQGGCPVAGGRGAAPDGGSLAAPEGGAWRWEASEVVPGEDGGIKEVGESLAVVDLEKEEWESFAKAIADLARRNMQRPNDFDSFIEWYTRNGPYDILVDGANVAFYGQNCEGGGFAWPQVRAMMDFLAQRYPAKKILLMLHRKRLNDNEARNPTVQAFVEQLKQSKSFYATPPGANDDWFWMYACVSAQERGMLVSNDQLRDHIFSLLRPKHFLKWRERHISRFYFAHPLHLRFELNCPPPYSRCVQQLPGGAWLLPVAPPAYDEEEEEGGEEGGESGGGRGGGGGGKGPGGSAEGGNELSGADYQGEEEQETWLCIRPVQVSESS